MKKIVIGLLLSLAFISDTKATHLYGGEVSWECLANGMFIFKMDVYRECSGANFNFVNQTLEVLGTPRPTSTTGQQIASIILKPDSNTWINQNNGDITPANAGANGVTITCANADRGAIQRLPFVSDPIRMNGVPPAGGWTFFWDDFARPGGTVVNGPGGAMGLRAVMYRVPDPSGSGFLNVNQCEDSSPSFAELPALQLCRGYTFTFNHNAQDSDLDSLFYAWDQPVGTSPTNFIQYAGPTYTFNNPLPDQNADPRNIPISLDPLTGQMQTAVYSGSGPEAFVTVVRIDAFRAGYKIASIYRDIPFLFFDCPQLAGPGGGANGGINNPPSIQVDGVTGTQFIEEVFAGEKVELSFVSQDTDLDYSKPIPYLQTNTLEPSGFLFSRNYANETFCEDPAVEPCATLDPPPVQTPGNPYQLSALSGVSTAFKWQTDCNHLGASGTGQFGVNQGIFNFVMKTYDDFGPIRGINYPSIVIKVNAPPVLEPPYVVGSSVELNGQTTLNWVPPIDSANTFNEYDITAATINNGLTNLTYVPVQAGIKNYKQEKTFPFLNFPQNIYTPFPINKDYYFRMITYSGCAGDIASLPSDAVQVMEVVTSGVGVPNSKTRVQLDWNAIKPANAATKPYFIYQSQTKYYIYENVEAINNTSLADPSKWALVGNTYGTTFTKGSSVCKDLVGFRVEARDTIITYAQGSRIDLATPQYDTLTFSTFGIIDTMRMEAEALLPAPELDSLEVFANGDVELTIDLGTVGTAGTFEILRNIGGTFTQVGSILYPNNKFTDVGAVTSPNVPEEYQVRSIDKCVLTTTSLSVNYQTIGLSGTIPDSCTGDYLLNWNFPSGLDANNGRFKIYHKKDTNTTVLVKGNISNTSDVVPALSGNSTNVINVVAEDGLFVNISEYNVVVLGNKPSTEILRAPDVRCVEVLESGDVKIVWAPWDPATFDTTSNFIEYGFRYRTMGSNNFIDAGFSTIKSDTSYTFSGLNAQTQAYELEAVSYFSGCEGKAYDTLNTSIVRTIELSVVADANKVGNLTWNGTGIAVSTTSPYSIFSNGADSTMYTSGGAVFIGQNHEPSFNDSLSNAAACDDKGFYYVQVMDQIGNCISQSNIVGDKFLDEAPPIQLLDYVSVLSDGSVRAYWSDASAIDVDSLYFIKPNTSGPGAFRIDSSSFNEPSKRYTLDLLILDASDSSRTLGVQAKDLCDKTTQGNDFDYHKTMDIKLDWNSCDSTIDMHWNPYTYFHIGDSVEYTVRVDSNINVNNFYDSGDPTFDTTYRYKVGSDFNVSDIGRDFRVYVYARPYGNGLNSFWRSNSNRKDVRVSFASTPKYTYTHYVNVLDDNEVELQVYPDKDTAIFGNIGRYVIFRGETNESLAPIGSVSKDDVVDSVFRYRDYSALTNEKMYFYKVVVENECGGPVDTSNFGTSIYLTVNADNEALTNTLYWNEYHEWDSTVSHYNVYRSYNNGGFELYEEVEPSKNGLFNSFIDDVYTESEAIGDFCYMIEAVQSAVTQEYDIDKFLDTAISRSNEVCVTQLPLFYVPNAFTPNGVNKIFKPKGQFFDFSFYEMTIYNRWGELVFESNYPEIGWNGSVKGKEPQIGSYVYVIRFKDSEGKEHRRKGTVTIIE